MCRQHHGLFQKTFIIRTRKLVSWGSPCNPSAPGNHWSTFSIASSGHFVSMESCMWPLCLAAFASRSFQSSFTLRKSHYLIILSYTLTPHFGFPLISPRFLWTIICKFTCAHMFLFSLVVEFLGHKITLCWTFWGIVRLFSQWLFHSYQHVRVLMSPWLHHYLLVSDVF